MNDAPVLQEPTLAPAPAPVLSRGKSAAILAALLMGLLLGALDNFIVATVLPVIAADLNDSTGKVFVVISYLIAQTVAIPIFGKLSDRFGRRSFYLLGLAIFLVGSTLSAFSQNLDELVAFRAVQGLGSGAFFTVVFSIVADIFPPKAAARLVGILSGVFGIAIVFGPLIGSYIVDTTTWRWIFAVNIPIGLAAIVLVLTSLGPLRPAARVRPAFDTWGSVLLASWVGVLIFALFQTSNGWAWTDPRTVTLLAIALALFPVFLWQELRSGDALVPLHYFRNRLIAASSGINFLRGAILTVVVTLVPVLVVDGLGGSTDAGRNVLYAFMVPMVIGAAFAGAILPRTGYRSPLLLGMLLTTLGCILLPEAPTSPPVYRFVGSFLPVGILGALIPLGFGVGMTFAPTQLAIQYSVPRDEVGTASSLVWFISNLGGAIVLSIVGAYQVQKFNSLVPSGALAASNPAAFVTAFYLAVAESIQYVWWIMVPLAVVGIVFAALIVGRLPPTPHEAIVAEPVAASTSG
ncbi:MAG: MFS transporter [Thermoplasmata archaeon]|nr:MFS transporter [Thermoplasmata archaeon]